MNFRKLLTYFAFGTAAIMPFAGAQNPTILQGNYITNVFGNSNFVLNPNAQTNVANVTVSSATVTRSTTTPLVATSEFNITTSTSTGYADWSLRVFDEGMKNNNCEARFTYRGFSVGSTTAQILQGANVVAQLTLTASTDPRIASINFPCGDLSAVTKFRLQQATASLTGTNEIGAVYVGLATNMANVAQAENVVRASRSTAQTIGSGAPETTIVFPTEDTDVYNEYNTTDGKFTPKRAGNYYFSSSILFSNVAWTQGQYIDLIVSKNGTRICNNETSIPASVTTYFGGQITCSVFLAVGDYAEIRILHNRGSNTDILNAQQYNWLTIARFPSSSELVVKPETQNVFGGVSAYGGSATAITAAAWTNINNAGAVTRSFFGKASVPTTTGDVALKISSLPVGTYNVTFTGQTYAESSASGVETQCLFAITDGSTRTGVTAVSAFGDATAAAQRGTASSFSAIFTNTAVQDKTFSVQAYRTTGGGSCNLYADSGRPYAITVTPLDQPSNSALYVQGPILGAQTGAAIPEGYVNEFSTRSISDTSARLQSPATLNTWYYPWTGELTLPAGNWNICMRVAARVVNNRSPTNVAQVFTRLENKTDGTSVFDNVTWPTYDNVTTYVEGTTATHFGCQPIAITTSKVFRVGIKAIALLNVPTGVEVSLRGDLVKSELFATRLN